MGIVLFGLQILMIHAGNTLKETNFTGQQHILLEIHILYYIKMICIYKIYIYHMVGLFNKLYPL